MKWIKLRYLAKGRRTVTVDMHGFEGPAKKPKDSVLMNAGEYIKKGQITTAYQLAIPPNNLCEIVDTQYNREKLRKLTVSNMMWDNVQSYDAPTGKYIEKRIQRSIPPCFKIEDGTDVFADLTTPAQNIENSQIAKLLAKIEAQDKKIEAQDQKLIDIENAPVSTGTTKSKTKKIKATKKVEPILKVEIVATPPKAMSDENASRPIEEYGNIPAEGPAQMENKPTEGVTVEVADVAPNVNKFGSKIKVGADGPIDTKIPASNPFPV